MSLFSTIKSRLHAAMNPDLNFEARWVVTVTEQGIDCVRPNGVTDSINWKDLEIITVQTTDEGPFVADVFFYLTGKTSGCFVPLGATGYDSMLTRLQSLAGFDNEMLAKSMSSISNQKFIVWQKAT